MARLPDRAAAAARGRRSGGSHVKMTLMLLVVLAGVASIVNLAPSALHAELHARTAGAELRQLTEGQRPRTSAEKRLQEELDLEAADGLTVGSLLGGREGAGGGAVAQGTRTFEHTFETIDGTGADTSADAAEVEKRREQEVAAKKQDTAQANEVNTTPGEKYHVICSLGSGAYTEWQSRVSYYWYKKTREKCITEQGDACPMGGYTRLLHSGKPDDWMDEIPTVVVDPLPPDLAAVAAGYVVLERPYAFKQWAEKYLDTIPENYIWMGEPDHVFLLAPPLWATPERPAAFPFFYIEPKRFKHIIDRFNPKGVAIDQFDAIGNSPVQIHKRQFAGIVDKWFNLSIAIKQDPEADKEFGWVQEMYAYSIAAATALDAPVRHKTILEIQLQPPWDASLKAQNGRDAFQIHFTYGNDFDPAGQFTPGKVGAWHWDKRDWTWKYPPRNFPMPPEGCTNEAVKTLISRINEAANVLPGWAEREGALPAPAAQTTRRLQAHARRGEQAGRSSSGSGSSGSGSEVGWRPGERPLPAAP
ncbi:hypothetical protein C2E21_6489 [Chlorella sorokiniana]|uniref:Hydroxyproline O-arabinosyltransferase-like domain-containing protein n=1 Tax=Chlorella sorokiniana TaxID=3076 RepID=A0A2P6TKU2_CHLSO|nr:hypothetical protein C2E21_6489 [Chlorella sorokiniana]|eukprot:PRW44917.1 hypothetical protein C2E21_6489 [Chlorella sorokiniana]